MSHTELFDIIQDNFESYTINSGYAANGFRSLDETLCPEFTLLGGATIEVKNFKELPLSTKIGMFCGLENHCATCDVDPIIENLTGSSCWFVGEKLYDVYKETTSRYLVYLPREDRDCDRIVGVEDITDFVRGISSIPSDFSEMKGENTTAWDRWEDILFVHTEDVGDRAFSAVVREELTTEEVFKKIGYHLASRHSIYGVTPEISFHFEPFPVPDIFPENIVVPGTASVFNADYDGDGCLLQEAKLENASRKLSSKEEKFARDISANLDAILNKHNLEFRQSRMPEVYRQSKEHERTNESTSRDIGCIMTAKERVEKASLRYVNRTNPETFLQYLLTNERDCLASWVVSRAADCEDPTRDLVKIGYHCIKTNSDRYFYECVKDLLAVSSFEKYRENIRILDAKYKAICTEVDCYFRECVKNFKTICTETP